MYKLISVITLLLLFNIKNTDSATHSAYESDNPVSLATCPDTHDDNLAVLEAFITESNFAADRQTYGLSSATTGDIVALTDQNYTSTCNTLNQEHSNELNATTDLGHKRYKLTFYKVNNRYIVVRTSKKPPVANTFNLSLNGIYIYDSNLDYLGGVTFG